MADKAGAMSGSHSKNQTEYTGKHSEAGKRGPGPEKGQIDAYKGKGNGAPASAVGGSLARKGKAEICPYGGSK